MKHFIVAISTMLLLASATAVAKPWSVNPGVQGQSVMVAARTNKKGAFKGKKKGAFKGNARAKAARKKERCFTRCAAKNMEAGRPPNACIQRCS